MAPRSTWKGFLRLSLVSVPVKAFTANNTAEEIRLNQLHTECNSRIQYKKTCPAHGEVGNDEQLLPAVTEPAVHGCAALFARIQHPPFVAVSVVEVGIIRRHVPNMWSHRLLYPTFR